MLSAIVVLLSMGLLAALVTILRLVQDIKQSKDPLAAERIQLAGNVAALKTKLAEIAAFREQKAAEIATLQKQKAAEIAARKQTEKTFEILEPELETLRPP